MRKLKGLATAALIVALVCPSLGVAQGRAPQLFVLFVDDLHLDFRSTPRLRELMKRTMRLLSQDGVQIALVTTGVVRASAVIYAFTPRVVGGPMPPPSVGNESAWEAYDRGARDSLRSLAESTGGRMVSAAAEFDSTLAHIARTANE